jgi:hypothetical protein
MVIILFFFKQKGGNPVKKFVVILLVVVASTLSLYAERINTATQGEVEGMFFEGGNFDYSSFQFALGGFDLEKSEVKDGTFLLVKGLQGDSTSKYGYPQLPVQRVWIEIPYGVEPSIEVSGETYFDYDLKAMGYDFPIYPQQPSVVKLPDATQPFVMDKKVYSDDCFYPEENLKIEGETFVRAHRILNVLIQPFQYNPAKNLLRVYTSFSLKVKTENSLYDATVAEHQRTYSQSYEDYLSKKILNYGIYNISDPKTSYKDGILVITYDSFNTTDLQNYVELKRKWGYKVQVATLTQTGSTATAIKSYIQNAYNTWSNPSLGFVIFIGAYEYIPATNMTTGDSATKTDLYYQTVSGGDILPDISLARMTISSTSQLSTVLTRLTNYQLGNFTSTAWIDNISYLGTCDSSYYTVAEGTHNYCVTNYTSPAGYTGNFPNNPQAGGDKLYCVTYSASDQNCIDRFNQGRSIVTHSGHCSPTQFAGPYIYVSNVQSLTNGEKTPFVIGHCCQSNQWEGTALTIGEAWLQSASIGYWGSVDYTYWTEDDLLQKDWYNEVYTNGYYRVGQFTDLAKIDFYNNPGGSSRVTYYLEEYNLNGDPTLEIWTNQPSTMTVTHDSAIIIGSSSYQVTVKDGVNPISQALVCLYKPDEGIHEVALTNSSGVATVGLSPAITNTGNVNLMVTKHDYKPYQATLTAISPSGPYLSYQSYAVVQEISGNGDGIVNPGETIQMSITLKNVGSDEGTGISGTLSTTSSDVSITDNYAQYPDISANGTGSSITNHYTFVVGSGVANGYSIPFTLNWSATGDYSGSVNFAVPVCVPLTISGVNVTNITGTSATINWSTNVPSTSLVNYGTSIPPSSQMSSDSLVTTHTINLTGLTQCTSYRFSVSSTSAGCYTILDTNGGSYYNFTTKGMGYALAPQTFESGSTGWTLTGQWHQDNCKAHGGSYAMKAGAAEGTCPGQYDASTTSDMTTSSSINLGSTGHGYHLRFWEYYQTESGWDYCRVQISTNGTTFTNLVDQYAGSGTTWTQRDIDLSAYTGNIWIRFEFYADSVYNYEGWYIDDVEISKSIGCSAELVYQGRTFTDSCSGTGSGNNDGYIDPGEDVSLNITLFNSGSLTGTGITGTITTTTTGVTITDGSSAFPAISSGGTGVSTDGFGISVGTGLSCGTTLNFTLHTTSNENPTGTDSYFTLTVGNVVTGSQTALYSESFDGTTFPPSGWNQVDVNGTSGNWARSTATVHPSGGGTHTGAGLAYFNSYTASSGQSTRLYRSSSTLIPSGSASAAVKFWMYHDTGYPSYTNEGVNIQISTNGSTWTTIGTLIPRYDGTTGWKEHSVDISSYIGQSVYLGILGVSQYGNDCHIDDVSLTYTTQPSCTIHACTPGCTTPSKPVISSITDVNGCSQNGITITFTSGTPATRHDLYKDGAVAQSSVTSPISYNPGDVSSHSYKIRAVNSSESCYNESDAVSGTDANGTPSQPVITSIVDIDPNNLTGIQVNYTSGTPATRHDLYKDGSLAVSSYVSGATYQPGDNSMHSYVVKAINGTCTTDSAAVNGTDAYSVIAPPEIAVGANYTWPTVNQAQQTMGWNTEATATGYRVYRGTLANLGNLCSTGTDFCTRYDGTNTTLDITSDNPATIDSTNKVIYYLIVAYNAGGEGPSGTATCGARVVNTTGTCP